MSGFPLNVPNLLEPEPEPEKERNNDCFNCVQKPNKNKAKKRSYNHMAC